MSSNTGVPAQKAKPNVLANKVFRTVLLSNIMLQIGIWVRNFAILLFVTDKTNNDPTSLSLIMVAEFAPIFIFSFIGGTFADRWRPKRTMIVCDFLSAASIFMVLITIYYNSWEMVYFATLVSAILSQFSQPSAMKLFKQHIPQGELQQSMALFQSVVAIFMVIGPALGTFVYQTFGIYVSIGVMGVAFLLSAVVLFALPKDKAAAAAAQEERRRFWGELSAGFQYVWKSPVLKSLGACFALAGLSVGIIQTLALFIVIERLGQPKEFLQYFMMVNGVAMLVGGGLVFSLSQKIKPQKLLALGMLLSAISIVGIGISTSIPFSFALQFIGGLAFPAIQIGISTMILSWTEDKFVGRVNGVLSPMFVGMMVIMMACAGMIKKAFPLIGIYSVSGILMLLGMLILVPLFKYQAQARHPEGQPQMTSH